MGKSLFEKRVIGRSHLRRAAIAYGGVQAANDSAFRSAASSEKAKYESSKGGLWNYDDLLIGLREIARGGSAESLRTYLSGLAGPGEADSKISLLDLVFEKTSIKSGAYVDVGSREIDLGDDFFLLVSYDLAIKVGNEIHCFVILPQADPLKENVRDAIISEFKQPFSGMTDVHKLQYVENPKVAGRRAPYCNLLDFEFSAPNGRFREFLKVYAEELDI